MALPNNDDVVVWQKRGTTRDAAVAQALKFATHQHVTAWFVESDADVVLLGTFRKKESGTRKEADPEPPNPTTHGITKRRRPRRLAPGPWPRSTAAPL